MLVPGRLIRGPVSSPARTPPRPAGDSGTADPVTAVRFGVATSAQATGASGTCPAGGDRTSVTVSRAMTSPPPTPSRTDATPHLSRDKPEFTWVTTAVHG